MAYRITNAMLKHNILKAIEEGRLAMQHEYSCEYVTEKDGRELRCVVGTCLPDDLIERCRSGERFPDDSELNGTSAVRLHETGLVEFEDVDFANDLQLLHDGNSPYWGADLETRLKIIKEKLAKKIPDETGA